MRTTVPAWKVVVVINIPVTVHIHIPRRAAASLECCRVLGFLLHVGGHFTRLNRLFDWLRSQFPPGAVTPIMAHAADFRSIGVVYLRVNKQVIPVERKGNI